MANDHRTLEGLQGGVGKDARHEPIVLNDGELILEDHGHAGRFLPSVLQSEQGVVTVGRHVDAGHHNAHHPASFL